MRPRPPARGRVLGLVAAGAVMLLCCGGVGIVGSCLALGVGSWVGGIGVGTLAAVVVLWTAVILPNRRRCRGVRHAGEHERATSQR